MRGFAPTSRAANRLRGAEISAGTLQGFLARSPQSSPERQLYMLDESTTLASTKQVRGFLAKPGSGIALCSSEIRDSIKGSKLASPSSSW